MGNDFEEKLVKDNFILNGETFEGYEEFVDAKLNESPSTQEELEIKEDNKDAKEEDKNAEEEEDEDIFKNIEKSFPFELLTKEKEEKEEKEGKEG